MTSPPSAGFVFTVRTESPQQTTVRRASPRLKEIPVARSSNSSGSRRPAVQARAAWPGTTHRGRCARQPRLPCGARRRGTRSRPRARPARARRRSVNPPRPPRDPRASHPG
jgi:hypothetical protein